MKAFSNWLGSIKKVPIINCSWNIKRIRAFKSGFFSFYLCSLSLFQLSVGRVQTIRSQTIQPISNSDISVKLIKTFQPKTIQTVLKFSNVRAKTLHMQQNIEAFIRRVIINSFQMHIKQIKLTEPKVPKHNKTF